MKIFVCSPVKDLSDLRDELYRSLKDLGHIPWFSEKKDFPTNRHLDSMTNCIKVVEECDLFLLLLDKRAGLRYTKRKGSPYPELFDLTISEAEYRRAREKRKPICIFIRERAEHESAIYRQIKDKEQRESIKWYSEPAVYEFYDRLMHEKTDIPWRYTFDSIEEIMGPLNTIIEDIDNKLKDILENSGVLFIGEKVSEISDVPNFGDFVIDTIEFMTKCIFTGSEHIVLKKNLRSESAFKMLHDEIGDDILICFEKFNNYEPKPIHYYIANEIKNGKWVFTTNRDNLIEKAGTYSKINIENKMIFKDGKFKTFYENIQRHQLQVGRIFKLNGGFDKNKKGNKKFKPFLDSLEGVGKNLNRNKMEVLKYFLGNFDFCFLGYNCLDKFSIDQVLKNTPTEKEMFWFNVAEQPIEIIDTPKHLENENMIEKNKRLIDRSRETLCINNILLKRKKFLRITGNWIEIIQNNLCPALDIAQYSDLPSVKKKETPTEWFNLRERIDDYKKRIIQGRLWEMCLSKEKAIRCFGDAEKLGEGINKAQAKLNLARVYDKQYGEEEKINVINNYRASYKIYKNHPNHKFISEAALCKIGLANFIRRALKQSDSALDECKKAIEMLELVKERDEKYKLAYSQYLNCLGLIYYSKLGSKDIDQCIDLFAESLKYKEEIGDTKGIAETENAIGLTIIKKGNIDIKEISNAISHLEKSLEINESIGNYIGAARNCRNLGLCYKDLINLVKNKNAKKENFQLAKESYKSGVDYWHIMVGDPPIEEFLEYKYRLGELEVNHGDINEGITFLQEVKEKWYKLGKLHNCARSLDLLRKAYNSIEYISSKGTKDVESTIDEIIRIYKNVLGDINKLKRMKQDENIFRDVVQILKRTEETIIGLKEYDHKTDNLEKIENLRKIMGETVSKSNI